MSSRMCWLGRIPCPDIREACLVNSILDLETALELAAPGRLELVSNAEHLVQWVTFLVVHVNLLCL